MQDSESKLLPDSPCRSSLWALHSQKCLVFQGFPNSPETKNQVLLLPPISPTSGLFLRAAPALVIHKWPPSSVPADVKMQRSASDVCASGSLMGAPGRGEKMILEFQRSLLHRNNENCPHVEKKKKETFRCDHWKVWQSDKELTRLEFHSDFKKERQINEKCVRE